MLLVQDPAAVERGDHLREAAPSRGSSESNPGPRQEHSAPQFTRHLPWALSSEPHTHLGQGLLVAPFFR